MTKSGSARKSTAVVVLVAVLVASTLVVGFAGVSGGSARPTSVAALAPSAGTNSGRAVSAPAESSAVAAAPAQSPAPLVTCTYTVPGENAGDTALQTAINAATAGSTICIGAGSYPEQLTIKTHGLTLYGAGNSSTIIAPTSLVFNTVDWDSAGGGSSSVACGSYLCVPTAAIILVENTSSGPTTGVTIANLQVNGAPGSSSVTCGDDYVGVDFQDSSGTLTSASVVNVASPLSSFGCQEVSGAVYAYNGYYFTGLVPSPAITVTVTSSTVTGYQKNGITCDDLGETCVLTDNTVTGIGTTTLNAQNGIQIAYGASATVTGNHVSGDHYTGDVADNADYFAPVYTACGILVYDAGNTVHVLSNVLSGDDLGIAVLGTASVNVSNNDITQGFSYGITFDLNASSAYLGGMPIYSTDSPWTSTAHGNTLQNVNVGVLVYDNNVSISGGSATSVNVSVESMLDSDSAYTIGISGFTAQVNVSGALLGDISTYQSTTGYAPQAVGTYTLTGDTLTAVGGPAAAQYGVLLNASSATVTGLSVNGFGVGIQAGYVFPVTSFEPIGTYVVTGNTVTAPVGGGTAGDEGILVAGASETISHNTVSGYYLQTTSTDAGGTYSSWFEDAQSVGIYGGCAQGSTKCIISQNTLTDDSVGIVDALMTYGFQSITPSNASITMNTVTDSGSYGVLVEATGAAGSTLVLNNLIDNSASGAPGVFLDGTDFLVQGNVLIGTSVSGSNSADQGQANCGTIATASIEVSDCFNPTTTATLKANFFEGTSVYWSSSFTSNPATSYVHGGELVSVTEQGLPSGAQWSLLFTGGPSLTTPVAAFVMDLPNGSMAYTATSANPYYAAPAGTIVVGGAPTSVTIQFSHTPFEVTFTETNLPATLLSSKGWTVVLGGTAVHVKKPTVNFEMLNGSYSYLIVGPAHQLVLGIPATGTITVAGAAVVESFQFASGPTYAITFAQAGLPGHESWCVSLNGWHLCSSTRSLQFGNLTPGVYTYSVAAMTGQTITAKILGAPVPLAGTLTVRASPIRVALKYVYPYAVTFSELGLSSGTWSITILGATVTEPCGSSIAFQLPNGTYSFKIGTVSGYTSLGTVHALKVRGGATTVTVFFWSTGHDPTGAAPIAAVPIRTA